MLQRNETYRLKTVSKIYLLLNVNYSWEIKSHCFWISVRLVSNWLFRMGWSVQMQNASNKLVGIKTSLFE